MIKDNTFEDNLILIGKNAEENDIIIKNSKQNDVWFHLANLSSCHVVIKCTKKHPINKEMIQYCAEVCKANTKYKELKSVVVNYCDIKQVMRTNIPGKVELKGKVNSITL